MPKRIIDDFLQNCWFHLYDLPEAYPESIFPNSNPSRGGALAGFNYVAFPGVTATQEEIREGTWPWSYKVNIHGSVDLVTLRKGMMANDSYMYDWVTASISGVWHSRRSLILYQLDARRYARRGWHFIGCLPQTYRGSDVDATSSDVNVEEMTISVNSIINLDLGKGFPLDFIDLKQPQLTPRNTSPDIAP